MQAAELDTLRRLLENRGWRLRFNRELEREFQLDYFHRYYLHMQIAGITGLLVFLACGFLDMIWTPEVANREWLVRVIAGVPMALPLVLSFWEPFKQNVGKRLMQPAICLFVSSAVAGLVAISLIAPEPYNYYYYNDPPDGERLNEAHKKYEQVPRPDPAEESQTDRYFEQGVSAFEAGDYAAAAQKFHEAQQLTPNDIVLPFARVQALFAAGEYHTATAVLREALVAASPEKEGVFYPRGLYGEEGILLKQIEQLSRAVQLSPADSDLRLLLGYQLLGMSRVDEAAVHLQSAGVDSGNNRAATVLMKLLEKPRKPAGADSNVEEPQPATPKPQEPPLSGNGSAKTPPTPKRKDVDMVAFAMAADNWLAAQ